MFRKQCQIKPARWIGQAEGIEDCRCRAKTNDAGLLLVANSLRNIRVEGVTEFSVGGQRRKWILQVLSFARTGSGSQTASVTGFNNVNAECLID